MLWTSVLERLKGKGVMTYDHNMTTYYPIMVSAGHNWLFYLVTFVQMSLFERGHNKWLDDSVLVHYMSICPYKMIVLFCPRSFPLLFLCIESVSALFSTLPLPPSIFSYKEGVSVRCLAYSLIRLSLPSSHSSSRSSPRMFLITSLMTRSQSANTREPSWPDGVSS